MFTFDCILLLKPLKLNHAHMFTSEAELQWCLEVGREALEMIMCFLSFLFDFIMRGGDRTETWAAGRTSED